MMRMTSSSSTSSSSRGASRDGGAARNTTYSRVVFGSAWKLGRDGAWMVDSCLLSAPIEVGALRDMEIGSAVLSSREEAAIVRSESLEQELHHQDAKVSELSRLCEELQKRVVCLQSGEEVERTRRQGAEAFGLAERQDQLLEDASARLELLKDESRRLREELRRAEEISQSARKILEPALLNARSCLGVAEGISGAVVEQPHRRGIENRGQFERTAMRPSELGNGGDDGEVREASLEGLAREAAEVLSLVLVRARNCTADATSYRWAGSASGNEFHSAGDERPLRDSNVETAFEAIGADQLLPRDSGDEMTGCGTPGHGTSGDDGNLAETYSSSVSRPSMGVASRNTGQRGVVTWGRVDGRERSGDMVQRGPRGGSPLRGGGPDGRTGRRGGDSGGGAPGGAGQYSGRRRGGGGGNEDERGGEDGWQAEPSLGGGGGSRERSEKGSHCSRVRGPRNTKCSTKDGGCGKGWGGAGIAIPDCASIRRMEAVRRGEEGGASLIGGVKSRRRSYMQGERPGSTVNGKNSTRSGSRSPGTAIIRQRIRDAQTTLRTLRSTTD